MGEKSLVKKIGWAYEVIDVWPSDIQSLARWQKLEDEGFGMLADKKHPERMDISDSVVCPDGLVYTLEQINNYKNRKGKMHYNSKNPEDVKMHKAYVYYLGFKSF